MAELEELLIKVNSELGDLSGIDSAVRALTELKNFSAQAASGADSLLKMSNAFSNFGKLGNLASGVKKVKDNVDDLIDVLGKLSKYTGKADKSIDQIEKLGKAMQAFSGLGDSLKGLDKVADGINGIVDAMAKLGNLESSLRGSASAMKDFGKSMDFSKQNKEVKSTVSNTIKELKKLRNEKLFSSVKSDKEIPLVDIKAMEKQLSQAERSYAKVQERLRKSLQTKEFAESNKSNSLIDSDKLLAQSQKDIEKYENLGKELKARIEKMQADIASAYDNNQKIRQQKSKVDIPTDFLEVPNINKEVDNVRRTYDDLINRATSVRDKAVLKLKKDKVKGEMPFDWLFNDAPKNAKANFGKPERGTDDLKGNLRDVKNEVSDATSATDSFAKSMNKVADNAKSIVDTMGKYSEIAKNIAYLSDADYKSSQRPERGFFGNYETNFASKEVTSKNKHQIEVKDVDKRLAEVKDKVDSFFHSHPHNLASFSPNDIIQGYKKTFDGISKEYAVGYKEISSFDFSKLSDKSKAPQIAKTFEDNLKKEIEKLRQIDISQLLASGLTQKYGEQKGIPSGLEQAIEYIPASISVKLKDALTKAGYDTGMFKNLEDIIKEPFKKMDMSSIIDGQKLSAQLSENIIKAFAISPSDVNAVEDSIQNTLDIIRDKAKSVLMGEEIYDDKFQSVVKNSLRDALDFHGEQPDKIYKSFPIKEYLESLNQGFKKEDLVYISDWFEKRIEKLNVDYQTVTNKMNESISSFAKAPKIKSARFKAVEDTADGFESIRNAIKILNEFREAIEKFEGVGSKLSNIDEALSGINGIIDILKVLSEYTGMAGNAIAQLGAFGEALQQFGALGVRLQGLENIQDGIYKMIDVLKVLSEYKGKATSSITQLNNLGKALQEFSNLGDSLQGLDKIYKGVDKMVATLSKLANVEGSAQKSINQLAKLGIALHEFNGLDESLVNLNEISIGLINLSKATDAMKGTSLKDFEYIPNIAASLNAFDGVLTGRQYANVANITSALAQLVSALKSTKQIDVGSIRAIGTAIEEAFNNDNFVKSSAKITSTLNALSKAYGVVATHAGLVRDTMSTMVASFNNASNALYDVRSNIEAISTDFTDALKPVTNSALFDTLKEFKKLNDSYKNVGGLGQGLGQLLDSLNSLKGRPVNIAPLRNILEQLEGLSKEKDLVSLGGQFDKLANMAQPVGILINSLKYTDLDGTNKTLTTLAAQLKKFYNDLPTGFDKISFTMNGIRNLVDLAKQDTSFDPKNNPITAISESLKGFQNLVIPNVADFVKNLETLLKFLNELPENTRIDTQPVKTLLDTLQYADSSMKNAEIMLTAVRSIGDVNKIDTSKFKDLNEELNNLVMIMGNVPTMNKDAFKGVADVIKALTTADTSNINPQQLELIVDALAKLADHLANIRGSNNKINITLDASGVANFTKVIEKSQEEYSRFARNLNEAIDDVDFSDLFDMDAPLKSLRRQLYEAERMFKSTQKQLKEEKMKVDRSAVAGARGEVYDRQRIKYEQLQAKAISLKETIDKLNAAIKNAPKFETDKEGYQYIKSLKEEYKMLDETMKRFNRGANADPTTRIGQGFQLIKDRMEALEQEIKKAEQDLIDMDETEEGLIYKTAEFANEMNRAADEAERMADEAKRAAQEMNANVSQGFSQFGSMLSGSGSKVLSSFGKLSSTFGELAGKGLLPEGMVASMEGLATALGAVATAVAAVAAVVGVVIALFKAWWDITGKMIDAMKQFIQRCIDFSKKMLSAVVGAFNAVAGAVKKVASMVQSAAQMIQSALRKIGEFGKNIISVFGKIGHAAQPAIKGIKAVLSAVTPKFVKTLTSGNLQLKKILKNSFLLGGAIKKVNQYLSMMGRMLMRKSITAFFNQVKQAFQDLAVYEKKAGDAMLNFNTNVSKIFSGMHVAANQWMAAFEPLINAITPWVTGFLDGVQTMGEAVAKFMAQLTGQPYYLRAKKFYEDYADNVENTSKKVKDLTNGLDELNILNDSKDDDSGIKPEDMWKKVAVDGNFKLPDFNIDVNAIIDKLIEWLKNIPWDKIKQKIRDFVNWIFDTFIDVILRRKDLWEQLGKTIGEVINSILTLLGTIIERFNPKDWESALSTLIHNIVLTVDWEYTKAKVSELAKKIAGFWNEVFKDDQLWEDIQKVLHELCDDILIFFRDFAWEFDFSKFADRFTGEITKFLKNFPWETLRQAVHNWVSGFVTFFNKVANNKEFWKTLGESVAKFISNTIVQALEDLSNLDIVGMAKAISIAIKTALDKMPWKRIENAIKKIARKIGDAFVTLLTDGALLTKIAKAVGKIGKIIINALNEIITKVKNKGREIGKKLASAIKAGLKEIPWDTVFKLPATALNAISNIFAGILDELPDGHEIADWLTSHIISMIDEVDWDLIHENLMRLAEKIRDFIEGVLQNEEFWEKAGEVTGKVITFTLDFLFNLVNINGEDLGTAIKNYINSLIDNVDVGKYLSKTVDVLINLVTAIDVVLTGVNWEQLGDQIAQGIVDAVDKIWKNRGLIKKTIEDAFSVVNGLIQQILIKMLANNSFYKIGETIGDVLMGVVNGLYEFFMLNGDLIIEGMKDLGKSLADYLRSHKAEIIAKLNGIIDSLVNIINAFFDEKGELWTELYDIISKLHLDKLITTIVREALIKLKNALYLRGAVWEGVVQSGILGELWTACKGVISDIWDWVKTNIINKIKAWFYLLSGNLSNDILSGAFFGKLIGELIGKLLFGGKIDWTPIFDGWNKFTEKLKPVKDWIDNKLKGIKDFLFGGKKDQKEEVVIPIDITPKDGEKAKLDDLVDTSDPVTLEFEDAKLGKITTKLIEADKFKGITLEVEKILAETLTLSDIFADKLHVSEIDSSGSNSGVYKNEKNWAGNDMQVESGTLYNDKNSDINADKITTPLLQADMIKSLSLQVNQIIAQQLTVTNIISELLTVKNIKSELLEVKKIVSQLLTVTKIKSDLLEVKKIKAEQLDVPKIKSDALTLKNINGDSLKVKNITATKLRVDSIEGALKDNSYKNKENLADNRLGVNTGTLYNNSDISADKITTPLLQAELIKGLTLQVNEIIAQQLTVTNIISELLTVTNIVSELLKVTEIVSELLKVTNIKSDQLNVRNIEAQKVTMPSLKVDNLNLDDIYADDLYLDDIYANTLHVDTIDGSISGGGGGGTVTIDDTPTPTSYTYDWTDYTPNIPTTTYDWTKYTPDIPTFDWSDYITIPDFNWSDYIPSTSTTDYTGDTYIPDGLRWSDMSDSKNAWEWDDLTGGGYTPTGKTTYPTEDYQDTSDRNINDYSDEMQYAYDRLRDLVGDVGAAGLMGNFFAESNWRPNNLQDSYQPKGMTDQDYVDWANSHLDQFAKDSKGFGLNQMTSSDRKQTFVDLLNGRSVDDVTAQLDYIEYELNHGFKNVRDYLRNAKSVQDASDYVLEHYEMPADQGTEQHKKRQGYSEDAYRQFAINGGRYDSPINLSPNSLNALNDTITNPLNSSLGSIEDGIKLPNGNYLGKFILPRYDDPLYSDSTQGGKLPNGNYWEKFTLPRYEDSSSPWATKNGLKLPSGMMPSAKDIQKALQNVDWNKVLKKLDWNKLLKNIDWNKLLSKLDINKLLDNINWEKVGDALLKNIDWKKIGEELGKAMADALKKNDKSGLVKNEGIRYGDDGNNKVDAGFPDAYLSMEDVADIHYRLEKIRIDTEQMLKNVKQALEDFKKKVKDLFKDFNLADQILDTDKLYDNLRKAEHDIEDFLIRTENAVKMWKDNIKKLLDEIKDAAKDIFKDLNKNVENELKKVLSTVKTYVQKIKDELKKLKDSVKGVFDNIAKEAQDAWKTTYYIIKQWIDEILKLIDKLKNAAKDMFKDLAKDADAAWKATHDAIKKWVNKIIELIKSINEATKHMWDGVVDEADAVWQALYYLIKSWVKKILDEIQKVKDLALDLFLGMADNAEKEWQRLLDVVKKFVPLIIAEMQKITDKAKKLFEGMVTAADEEFKKLYALLIDWIDKISQLFTDLVANFRTAIEGMSDAMNEEMRQVYDAVDLWLGRIAQLLADFANKVNFGFADAVKRDLDKAYLYVVEWLNKLLSLLQNAFGDLKLFNGKLEVFGTVDCKCDCGSGVASLEKAIKNIKCECTCCGNCNGCNGGSSGGGKGGGVDGGSVTNPITNTSNTNTGITETVSEGNGVIYINQGNGKVPLYANVDGKLVALNDKTTPDYVKQGVVNGTYAITDSKGNNLNKNDTNTMKNYLKGKGWGNSSKDNTGSSKDNKGSSKDNTNNSSSSAWDNTKKTAEKAAKEIKGLQYATKDQKNKADALLKEVNNAKDANTALQKLGELQKLQKEANGTNADELLKKGNDNTSNATKDKTEKDKTEKDKTEKDKKEKEEKEKKEKEEKEKKEKEKKEKEEKEKEEKKKSDKLAVAYGTGDLMTYDKDRKHNITSESQAKKYGVYDEFIKNRDTANKRVDQYRKEAEPLYQQIKKSKYYEKIKSDVDRLYKDLNTNSNLGGDKPYKNSLEGIKSYAQKAKEYDAAVKNSQKLNSSDWKNKAYKPKETQYNNKDTGYATKEDINKAKEANEQVKKWADKIEKTYLPYLQKNGTAVQKANAEQILKLLKNPTTAVAISSKDKIEDTYYGKQYQNVVNNYNKVKNAKKDTSTGETNTDNLSSADKKKLTEFQKIIDQGSQINIEAGGSYDKYLNPKIFGASNRKDKARTKEVADFINQKKLSLSSVSFYDSNTVSVPSNLKKSVFDYWYKNRLLAKGYQMGGIPNAGEFFVARENGTPEFVGSFGNKTAVANNDQIVTAVANGVSMANDRVVNAIENQTNSIENAIDRKDLDVQIGDRQIAEANRRGEKGLGQNFVN